jgi:hypothetical protein
MSAAGGSAKECHYRHDLLAEEEREHQGLLEPEVTADQSFVVFSIPPIPAKYSSFAH